MFAAVNVLCFIGGLLSIDKDRKWKHEDNDAAGARRVDWLGAFLISAGLVLILFVLGEGETAQKQWATSCTTSFIYLFFSLEVHIRGRHHRSPDSRHTIGWSIHLVAMVP